MSEMAAFREVLRNRFVELGSGSTVAEEVVRRQTRRAVVDFIRREPPTTVLGLLMTREEPISVEAIAGRLCKPVEEVEWTIELLEAEELCGRVVREGGLTKVFAFASYTSKNE